MLINFYISFLVLSTKIQFSKRPFRPMQDRLFRDNLFILGCKLRLGVLILLFVKKECCDYFYSLMCNAVKLPDLSPTTAVASDPITCTLLNSVSSRRR